MRTPSRGLPQRVASGLAMSPSSTALIVGRPASKSDATSDSTGADPYTVAMRGIVAAAGYVPSHRLERSDITAATGTKAGTGRRSVASFDEDTTTMAVEA